MDLRSSFGFLRKFVDFTEGFCMETDFESVCGLRFFGSFSVSRQRFSRIGLFFKGFVPSTASSKWDSSSMVR